MIAAWSSKNGMVINIKKSFVIHFGPQHQMNSYNVNGLMLDSKECIRDLGIVLYSIAELIPVSSEICSIYL
jgi:hypothetical protein